jgi:DNA replication protein DnaC
VHGGHRLPRPTRAGQDGHPPTRHLPLGAGASERHRHRRHRDRQDLPRLRPGYRALYRRATRLFDELKLARADGTYSRLLAKFARIDVLVLDDWGLKPVQDAERHDLLEILEDRHGLRSTLVTSQLPPAKWHDYLGDPTVADAILDRIVHHAHRIVLKGPSRRKETAIENQG